VHGNSGETQSSSTVSKDAHKDYVTFTICVGNDKSPWDCMVFETCKCSFSVVGDNR